MGDHNNTMDEEVQALAARLVRRLREVNATITLAESCTGGLLASTLTDIAGASEYFNQSWVCYSYQSKINELNVEKELLASKGAVNAQVAIQMAEGARERSGADIAISITGIAGPVAPNSNKPVGLVYVGIASAHWANAESVQMGGNRFENKVSFVHFALKTAIDCWDKAKLDKKMPSLKKKKQQQRQLSRWRNLRLRKHEKQPKPQQNHRGRMNLGKTQARPLEMI